MTLKAIWTRIKEAVLLMFLIIMGFLGTSIVLLTVLAPVILYLSVAAAIIFGIYTGYHYWGTPQ